MAKVFEAVTIGDLHLSKKMLLRLFGEQITELQLNAVRQVLDEAIGRGVKHALFLGDISDEPTLRDCDELALTKLLFEYDGRINIHIILGNHDIEQVQVNSLCMLQELSNRCVFKTVKVYSDHTVSQIDGVTVEFMPYPHSVPRHDNSVCIAHLERPGALRDNGTKNDSGIPEPKGNNLWVMGHLHTPQIVGNTYYAGTLYQTNAGESLPKRYYYLRARMGKRLEYKIEWHDAALPYEFRTIPASAAASIDANPLIKYRVREQPDVALPENFMIDNPNVVERIAYKQEVDLSTLTTSAADYDVNKRVRQFLRERGRTKLQMLRARTLIRMVEENKL